MATNVSASEVRYATNLSIVTAPDARLESAAFIPLGDAWIAQILSDNGELAFSAMTDANKKAIVKAAECWYVAGLVALGQPEDDFTAGPVQTKSQAEARANIAEKCFARAKELLSDAGYSMGEITVTYSGGDDYRHTGTDNVNVDFGIAQEDKDHPINLLGIETAP